MNIKKKDSTAILNSLYGGVVPNRGIEYILVGRLDEYESVRNYDKNTGFDEIEFKRK